MTPAPGAYRWLDDQTRQRLTGAENECLGRAELLTPDLDRVFDDLEAFANKAKRWGDLTPWLRENPPVLHLFNGPIPKPAILADPIAAKLYVRAHFYHTLVGRTLKEFQLYATMLWVQIQGGPADALLDLWGEVDIFLATRKSQLSHEECETLSLEETRHRKNHALALIFMNRVQYGGYANTSALEKKLIRDFLGTAMAKRMLGLEENAFRYLETEVTARPEAGEGASVQDQKEYHTYQEMAEEFNAKRISLSDWVHEHLPRKNLLWWNWWSISPFVAADASILLPMILELKRIRHLYLDLCPESQPLVDRYLSGEEPDEARLEKEIRLIYPPALEEYQKETMPYHVVLEKARDLGIPVTCCGLSGIDLATYEPELGADGLLEFTRDHAWRRLFYKVYQERVAHDAEDMVIFLHFMKPMHTVPASFSDERFERVIHVDHYTGFGPKRPETRLACFSRRAPHSTPSFVVTDLADTSLKDEPIVHFPFADLPDQPKMNDRLFNRFGNYNTLIYSHHKHGGNGGDDRVEAPTPVGEDMRPVTH